MTDDSNPRGQLTVRIIAMPADTNANGDIFGGWVMSRMDQAGGIAGVERASGRVVTIARRRDEVHPAGARRRRARGLHRGGEHRPHLDEHPRRGLGAPLPDR